MKPIPLACRIALWLLVLAATPARAGDDCDASPESWQPRSALSGLAQRNGWQIDRVKIDDGCYEVIGHDANGRQFKAKVDPASLQIISVKRGRHEHDRLREREGRGSPASTPGDLQ